MLRSILLSAVVLVVLAFGKDAAAQCPGGCPNPVVEANISGPQVYCDGQGTYRYVETGAPVPSNYLIAQIRERVYQRADGSRYMTRTGQGVIWDTRNTQRFRNRESI